VTSDAVAIAFVGAAASVVAATIAAVVTVRTFQVKLKADQQANRGHQALDEDRLELEALRTVGDAQAREIERLTTREETLCKEIDRMLLQLAGERTNAEMTNRNLLRTLNDKQAEIDRLLEERRRKAT
jgi:hypothetical protein